jgi:hypothetical protein
MATTFRLSKGDFRATVLANAISFISGLPDSREWVIKVEQFRKKRSTRQNRSLWGVAYKALSEATGNDPEDLHTYFLGEWSGWEVIDVMGQHKRVPMRRSSKLTTAEFSEFYEFIQRRAAEAGYNVPSPGEYDG